MWGQSKFKKNAHMSEEFSELAESTLNLLRGRTNNLLLKQIASESGLKLEWIKKFQQGKIKDKYNVDGNKIERLNKYLVSKLNPTLT